MQSEIHRAGSADSTGLLGERLHLLREAGQLAVCVVSMTELFHSARSAEELDHVRLDLSALPFLHLTPVAEQHVVGIMSALARRRQHRTPIPDLMLA